MRAHHLSSLVLSLASLFGAAACDDAYEPAELRVRCAASFEQPLRELAEQFRAETGVPLEFSAGPSLDLARELDGGRAADLYLFDDEELAFAARKRGTVREVLHLAVVRPVLVAPAGNPAGITELADIAREELRVGIPDPEHCGLGLHVRTSARFIGAWHRTRELADLVVPTEAQLADAVAAGDVDVAVLWDATANRNPAIERIEELKLEGHARRMTLAVSTGAPHVADALCFARWLRSRDRGRPVWEASGFTCIEGGDDFVRDPQMDVYVAERLRAAAEPALLEWSRREGSTLALTFDSDDELARRAATDRPEALFLFDDRSFELAGTEYDDREVVSNDPLCLVVYGMNPEGVEGLSDLTLDGLRVGLLARESGECGRLAWEELDRLGLGARLRESALVTTTNDPRPLLDAVRRKELDVALLHGTLAGEPTMRNDVMPLLHPAAELQQTFALRSAQEYPELAARLRDSLRTRETNERFFHLGYRWRPRVGAEPTEH
ncbi:MAG: substrate-binding domain-containing protein [Planctomycetes bacterium]|nr:substrate-binding domain-containing protein [Planctomycetota bacterium]MCB9903876.1 substrate-binding domain-containing protein [Planctomycetota bacterium]